MAADFVSLTAASLDTALPLISAFYGEEALDYREARARRALVQLLDNPAQGAFQFIRVDGQPVGYFVLTICFSLEFGGRFALLDEFYVVPAHRGRGVGAGALDHIRHMAESWSLESIRLEIDRANLRLRAFYGRGGFKPHERD